jgi:hypothetical protein
VVRGVGGLIQTSGLAAITPTTRGAEPLETLSVRPSRQNVTVKLVALTWIPRWQDGAGQSRPARQ